MKQPPRRLAGGAAPDAVLARFPKIRPPLPPEIQAIYARHYQSNREGDTAAASLSQKMEAWMHRRVAEDVAAPGAADGKSTLEIGAGTLNQLPYEPAVRHYDIVEPFAQLYQDSARLGRIGKIYARLDQVPPHARYQRITSIAVLEHLCDLPRDVARAALLLTEDGVFRVSIPSEGCWPWTLGWRLTTGLEFRLRHGADYGLLMRHEHVNTADEIEAVLACFFGQTDCRVFGLSRALSLYRYYECRGPKQEKCRAFLHAAGEQPQA